MVRVVITSPNCVREGDSENTTTFVITIELISAILCRDVVYTVELSNGTATGNPYCSFGGVSRASRVSPPTVVQLAGFHVHIMT